ncbi:NADPH-dependent F420 reductase [Glutamicibacter sp. MCAF14]|uniref:NADPH-dependent F420 reductase n=1 Tax=Glutamicibacter sp. MCAF14 TaxID=3233043 RepID=UPI003F90FAC1
MVNVSIIGTGNMGQAISSVLNKGGATIQMLGSGDSATAAYGDIIVLAVPYPAIESIIAERGDQFAGKVVVDITNPLNFETFDSLTVPADSSATAEIAKALPEATVIKAFNTNFAATIAEGQVGGTQTAVLIAGDDETAKGELSALVTAGGLRAIDAGATQRARELEGIGFMQISLAAGEKIEWTGGFGIN